MSAFSSTTADPEFVVCFRCQRATHPDDVTRVDAIGGEPLCPECEREVIGR